MRHAPRWHHHGPRSAFREPPRQAGVPTCAAGGAALAGPTAAAAGGAASADPVSRSAAAGGGPARAHVPVAVGGSVLGAADAYEHGVEAAYAQSVPRAAESGAASPDLWPPRAGPRQPVTDATPPDFGLRHARSGDPVRPGAFKVYAPRLVDVPATLVHAGAERADAATGAHEVGWVVATRARARGHGHATATAPGRERPRCTATLGIALPLSPATVRVRRTGVGRPVASVTVRQPSASSGSSATEVWRSSDSEPDTRSSLVRAWSSEAAGGSPRTAAAEEPLRPRLVAPLLASEPRRAVVVDAPRSVGGGGGGGGGAQRRARLPALHARALGSSWSTC
jgi:hypothetical protein